MRRRDDPNGHMIRRPVELRKARGHRGLYLAGGWARTGSAARRHGVLGSDGGRASSAIRTQQNPPSLHHRYRRGARGGLSLPAGR
jgi:hypothetical protein